MPLLAAVAVVAITAACGSPREPATVPAAVLAGPVQPPPVYALIGHREALQLTSEQITALDSIGQAVHAVNDPLIRRLRELRGDFRGRAQPDESLPQSEEVRTLGEQIRANNREAVDAVRETLTEEQRTRTCELFGDSRGVRRAGAERGQVRRAGAGGQARRTNGPETMRFAVWSWCAPPAEPADTVAAEAADEPAEP